MPSRNIAWRVRFQCTCRRGANPEIHRPYEVEQTFDVSFVGQCYENRPAVIAALRDAGIRVQAFGPG